MKVVLTGGTGLLGTALTKEAMARGHETVSLGRPELSVTDPAKCADRFESEAPDIVLHCAAYTAVDRAESEPLEAVAVNDTGTRNVVTAANRVGAFFVYPSSDYVFGGNGRHRPWATDDPPQPIGAYARSKLAGERAAADAAAGHLVVRTGWLYGEGGGNFVDTMLRLGRERGSVRVVNDQHGRPTWTDSLARTVFDLLEAGAEGVQHATDDGTATWCDLAKAALELAGIDAVIEPISTVEFGAPAPRPTYSVLDLERTRALLGRPLPHWKTSLGRYLETT